MTAPQARHAEETNVRQVKYDSQNLALANSMNANKNCTHTILKTDFLCLL